MSFQTNKGNVQKHRNIKICCDLSDLSAQPINEICLFSVMTVYNARKQENDSKQSDEFQATFF